MANITRAPACVDALEARIASNVTHWTGRSPNGRVLHFVEANCSKGIVGCGVTPEAAVKHWLAQNGLSIE